ncbi:hypothetical protein RD792_005358 [Penstemon davidsonii]|uniref:Uncharacterized protein n=1 Tax=Penstemon davidsonii TaxID=160366 RepID=A0ABR0DJX3_9LAMI|nr:hypothetical protein RD792_005358 [Penstemon davidsonii]
MACLIIGCLIKFSLQIFEGEGSFLGSVMESSDELYAAAASLGIEIQLFLSYSSEMTEEIILSCINLASKSSRGLYPKVSESETLAESFLTAFPSINPLSAHAILSSGNTLGKFLELSNEGKICAIKKYRVPDESVALLSATSKYGEREDCKSGLTDHSSSVSSVPDSGNLQFKSASEKKRLKYTHDPYNDVEPPNDLFHMEPLDPLPDDILNPPKPSVSCNSWLSGSAEISNKQGQFNSSSIDKLFSFEEFNANCWRSAPEAMKDHRRQSIKVPGIPQDKFIGEVIDVDDTPAFKECFSPFLLDEEKDYMARNSRMSGLSCGANITNPIDIDSASDAWISRRDTVQSRKEEIKPHFGTIGRRNSPMNCQRRLTEEDMLQKAPQNSYNPSFQQAYTRNSNSTPLSNALQSTQTKQGSPWTIEFLNRIREKSRLRQQSIPRNLSSSPRFNFSENASRPTKRKSPSIFEFYKYEGGSNSTPKKIVDQKRLKRTSQSLSSLKKNEKASASSVPPWTPIDKRAKRVGQ